MLITTLILSKLLHLAFGHGGSFYPYIWHSDPKVQPDPEKALLDFRFKVEVPIPEKTCEDVESEFACCVGRGMLGSGGGLTGYFTNNTKRGAPKATLPEDMYDKSQANWGPWQMQWASKSPWSAPGTAPVVGEGCGVLGGNPNGCHEGTGNLFGTSCGSQSCGSWEGGRSAIEYASEGYYQDAPVTKWKRGRKAAVFWNTAAAHKGGYAYRLCKIPKKGISGVTEKCFQDGHLEFSGKYTWLYDLTSYGGIGDFDSKNWQRVVAERTNIGTTPKNSWWTKAAWVNSYFGKVGADERQNWAYKDYVKVPKKIPAGDYILSFRWDCQQTHQVWNTCANIKVV